MLRKLEPELMDQPDLDQDELVGALRAIRRVNVVSRTADILWPHIREVARAAGRPLSLLDAATGSGDIPIALARKAAREGFPFTFEAVDINPRSLELARAYAKQEGVSVSFRVQDVLTTSLPRTYDIVTCSLFLHHLTREEAVRLLARLAASSRELLLVDDLCRSRLGFLAAAVGTKLLTRSRVAQVDGRLSAHAAFTAPELASIAEEAGLGGFTHRTHFPFRQLLCWSPRRPSALPQG